VAVPQTLDDALRAWSTLLGEKHVVAPSAAQNRYGRCTMPLHRNILAAILPATPGDIVACVKIAHDYDIPLYPISSGRNWGYGTANPVVDGCVILDLSRLDRVLEFDRELGLVTVEPGVTQRALYEYLEKEAPAFMVPVTGAGPDCSILANALERGYGITPHADHFAATMSLEAVLPDGNIYRTPLSEMGGALADRAHKWGVGPYLDGVFSQANLGIVTQMTIALARKPERAESFYFWVEQDATLEATVLAIRTILRKVGGATGSINLMNARRVLAMMVPYPHHKRGDNSVLPDQVIAELAGRNNVKAWMGIGTVYGTPAMVKAARHAIKAALKPVTRKVLFATPALPKRLRRFVRLLAKPTRERYLRLADALESSMQLMMGVPSEIALPLAYWKSGNKPPEHNMDPARDGCGLIWYPPLVPMKPDRVRAYVDMVTRICSANEIEPLITLTSLSERCFDSSVPILYDQRDASQAARAESCYQALFDAGGREGFLPYRMNVQSMALLTDSQMPFWNLVSRIKAAIDPKDIIAPGRYAPVVRRR
jgi:4-cresol dehydrogenase (hydroxylating) flavoprotein subunit